MAQKVVVSLVDDLDESEADETVEFGIDGMTYEIDLSEKNAAALRGEFADFLAHARRTAGRRSASTASTAAPAARRFRRPRVGRPRAEPGHSRMGPQAGHDRVRAGPYPRRGHRGVPPEPLTGRGHGFTFSGSSSLSVEGLTSTRSSASA